MVLEFIICLLDVLRMNLLVDEAMFLGVERTCELILWLLVIEKSNLAEVA
jgi:hypothetical protein